MNVEWMEFFWLCGEFETVIFFLVVFLKVPMFVPLVVELRGFLKYFPCILMIALCYVGLEL